MSDEMRRILEEQARMEKLLKPFAAFEEYERMQRLLKPIRDWEDLQRHINPLQHHLDKIGLTPSRLSELQEQERWRKLIPDFPSARSIADEAERIERQRLLLQGPVGDLKRLGLLDDKLPTLNAIEKIIEDQNRYQQQFRLPASSELSSLAQAAFSRSSITQVAMETEERLKGALGSISAPWLRIDGAATSASSISELISIGKAINIYGAFDDKLVEALRFELGDWRNVTMPSYEALLDPLARTDFYSSVGFNAGLTQFTHQAFDEGLIIGGLKPTENADEEEVDEDEEGFARAGEAFSLLSRFEFAVRRFIEEVMEDEFGADWTKHQLPANMLDTWLQKRDKARKAGCADFALIDYADFSEYEPIIQRKDNWNKVFKPIFGRAEDIGESFKRLYPIRISTMHIRFITKEDELLLRVETMRVLSAIHNRK